MLLLGWTGWAGQGQHHGWGDAWAGGLSPLWGQFIPDMPILTTTLYFIGALLFGALVIALVGQWRRRSRTDNLSPVDQLDHFRSLYEQGELSKEEFDSL